MTRTLPDRRPSSKRIAPRRPSACFGMIFVASLLAATTGLAPHAPAAEGESAAARFRDQIEPILADHCYGCHGNGIKKGSVTLDDFPTDESILGRKELWNSVLKNVRAGLMPPAGKPKPTAEELKALEEWIKRGAFDLDPSDPDPGRVTLRRLNRVEYRNTIRDLMGIDFDANGEFPPDDSGYGFDNVGDALSVSPLLLEKYMQAAETIVATAVPTVARVIQVRTFPGFEFRGQGVSGSGDRMTMYKPAKVAKTIKVEKAGQYKLALEVATRGEFNFDPGRAKVTFHLDDKELLVKEFGWGDSKKARHEFDFEFQPGEHALACEVTPLTPVEKRQTNVDFRILAARLEGPLAESDWVRPENFDRFFDRDDPGTPEARHDYAQQVLGKFASKAYRKPVDPRTLARLVKIADEAYAQGGKNFAQGVGQAMVAVIASPRFLFRVEAAGSSTSAKGFALVDEYSLASRLSYFLWSTMPDDELLGLAGRGELRQNLQGQVKRMLADTRSGELVRNFTGQWLQSRDFDNFPIQSRVILRGDNLPRMTDDEVGELRRSMRQETEAYFGYMLRQDRPILELIDSNYAFVNGPLAKLYGIPDVSGREVRKVDLADGSPRGGILTQAGVLMVTSNPGRTSAVKRGNFILENILGTPTPPPPPDIPSLEDALKGIKDREPTMREVMEVHRADSLCASCHNRMDPLGLAFENFNAMGFWRDAEKKQPIDASGKLVTGRTFKDARELKQILKAEYKLDIYRCLTEKMMTFALGRGPEYQDVETVDQVVDRVEHEGGKLSTVVIALIESSPFQKRRDLAALASKTPQPGSETMIPNDPSSEAMARQARLASSRRHFLRGLGAAVALPALESILPRGIQAAVAASARSLGTSSTGAPLRAAFLYVPNGVNQKAWWPTGEGSDFQFGRTMEPLAPLKDKIQVFGGLDHLNATAGKDGAGDHARASSTFLTGVRVKKTAGADIHAGISVDQVIAQKVGHQTRFPSLELTCDAVRKSGGCDSGYSCAYDFNMSWRTATTPMSPEPNPRMVFERLFGAGPSGERQKNYTRRLEQQKSILDFVLDDARELQGGLATRDKAKLDEYLTSVREIEARIQRSESVGASADPGVDTPPGIPAAHRDHIRLMCDMMVLAFQTDSTRVASLIFAHDGSNRAFPEIGIPEGHHFLSHHQSKAERLDKVAQIDLFYMQEFARFLEKLEATKDVDGRSILHNSMIVYGCGNGDGNRHNHDNLPFLLAGGGAGTLTPGRYIKAGSKPMSNVFLGMIDRFGIDGVERFGDSTERFGSI